MLVLQARATIKANLHWVARSSRARFFVCFIASRSCRAEPCTSAELPHATKQTKNRARLLLAARQCRLAFTLHFVRSQWHLLHPFQFAYNVNSAITFFMQSPRGAVKGKFSNCLAC